MNQLQRVVSGAATTAAVLGARRVVETGWEAVRGEAPPTAEDLSDDADLRDLFVWSALLLAAVFLARKLATSLTRWLLP